MVEALRLSTLLLSDCTRLIKNQSSLISRTNLHEQKSPVPRPNLAPGPDRRGNPSVETGRSNLLIKNHIAFGYMLAGTDTFEIEQLAVHQMRGHDVMHRGEDGLAAPRIFTLPCGEHLLDVLALQVFLRTAQVARDARKFH